MRILFDTNLWISFMIGRRLASLREVLYRHDVEVYVSEPLLEEIHTVIERQKFEKLISKETRYYFFEMVYDVCQFTEITMQAVSPIRDIKDAVSPIRDIKDIYLLSMAESVPVDYIVSGDKDLTDLKQHNGIPIIKYAELLELLKVNKNE